MNEQKAAPGWYPVPGETNTLRYYDGTQGTGDAIPAPGLDALEQIAADVRTIKAVAVLWAALTLLGILVVIVVVLAQS